MSCRSDLNRGLFVAMFKNLDEALSAGVGWAWRKDRESR
jgi:hypothetical protein